MKKICLISAVFLFIVFNSIFANEISFTVEVHGVTVNGGTIYRAIYSNNTTYKNTQPEYTFRGSPESNIVNFNLRIPPGDYVIQVYQDMNNNGQLDFGWFGIPKEPIGITNFNGRGIPGNFDRHKISIYNGVNIIVTMYRI